MKLPQQANLFHNDIKPIPYQVTTVEPSKNDSREGVVAGTRSYVPLHIMLDTSTTKSQQRSSESRSQLTKFYKNRYPNAAVSRLAPDPVNRGIDSIIKNTTPKLDSTTVGVAKVSSEEIFSVEMSCCILDGRDV
uniref:Uncharacterized protein n=1 Tax=Romanomermis culicivorax TaxID=13658 RepID=A0A915I1G7_ROMCU